MDYGTRTNFELVMKIDSLMKITRRNAVLCVLWVVFVLSLPIYVFLDGIQLRALEFVDRKKVLWLYR